MVIDKIGNINNIVDAKKTRSVSNSKETKKKSDSIQISSEGKKAADVAKVSQMVKETSDIRVERVKEIKEKIANGTYNFDNNEVLEMVADRIARFLIK